MSVQSQEAGKPAGCSGSKVLSCQGAAVGAGWADHLCVDSGIRAQLWDGGVVMFKLISCWGRWDRVAFVSSAVCWMG